MIASESYIISAKRTPIGSFQGLLSSLKAPELCSVVIESILSENNLVKEDVDEVIFGKCTFCWYWSSTC